MKVGNKKLFAPGYSVYEMRYKVLQDPELLCQAFRERVNTYYLKSANLLSAFAKGILCSTLVDFLAKILITEMKQVQHYRNFIVKNNLRNMNKNPFSDSKIEVGERFVTFLVEEIKVFSYEEGYCFYKYVRNGLIHEGRIKCGCYLDDHISIATQTVKGVLTFNPNIILQELKSWLTDYFQDVATGGDAFIKLHNYTKEIINEDFIAIKKRINNIKFPC